MSSDNPFQVPAESYGDRSGYDRDAGVAGVSRRTLEMLNLTRPWVSLMGVLLWIGTVLLGIGAVFIIIAAALSGELAPIFMGVLYVILFFVYASLASSLTKYAKRINALNASESVVDLEDALEAQKNFWRLIGIITLVMIIFYIVMLIMMLAGFAFLGNFAP